MGDRPTAIRAQMVSTPFMVSLKCSNYFLVFDAQIFTNILDSAVVFVENSLEKRNIKILLSFGSFSIRKWAKLRPSREFFDILICRNMRIPVL